MQSLKWKCTHADWFWERCVNIRVPISSLNYFHCLILACASGLMGDIFLIKGYSSDLWAFSNNHHNKIHNCTIITSSNFLALKQSHTQLIKASGQLKSDSVFLNGKHRRRRMRRKRKKRKEKERKKERKERKRRKKEREIRKKDQKERARKRKERRSISILQINKVNSPFYERLVCILSPFSH